MSIFFKDTKYKRFEIKPRFWDPQKEERERRERLIKAEIKMDELGEEQEDSEFREKFRRNYYKVAANRRKTRGSYAIRLFMILILIILICYYLLMRHFETIIEFFK